MDKIIFIPLPRLSNSESERPKTPHPSTKELQMYTQGRVSVDWNASCMCNLLHLYDVSVFVRLFWTGMGKTHPFLCLSRIHVVHLSEQLLAALRLKHLTLVLQRSWGFSQHLFLLPYHWSGECFTLSQSSSGACSCRVKLGKRDCHLWMLTSQRARGKQPQSVNVWVMLLIYLWVSSSLRLAAFWNVFAWNWRCSSAV